MKSSIARVVASAFSILSAALCMSASGAGLENEYVRSYGLKLMMPDPGGHWGVPKLGHYLPVEACAA